MKDKLASLIQEAYDGCAKRSSVSIADYLLANGVIVPPVKVGDSLWDIRSWANSQLSIINRTIEEVKVERIIFDEFGIGIETAHSAEPK